VKKRYRSRLVDFLSSLGASIVSQQSTNPTPNPYISFRRVRPCSRNRYALRTISRSIPENSGASRSRELSIIHRASSHLFPCPPPSPSTTLDGPRRPSTAHNPSQGDVHEIQGSGRRELRAGLEKRLIQTYIKYSRRKAQ
jgi:hypothetical protein